MQTINKEELPFCECGCGERVKKEGNRFIDGHQCRGKNNPMYGKKGEDSYWFNKHHTEETIQKMSKSQTGKKHTKKARQKMSSNHIDVSGESNPMYGNLHSEKAIQKMSKSRIGKYCGEKHPRWNPNLTDKERQIRRKYPEYTK